jgi:hypothetical protein
MNISTSVQTNPESKPQPEAPNAKRPRGAPKGNRNATRHGLYSRKSHAANLAYLKENTDLGRADAEIFLAVQESRKIALSHPSDERLRGIAEKRFFKLVMRRFGIKSQRDWNAMDFALSQVERDIDFPPERLAEIVRHLV